MKIEFNMGMEDLAYFQTYHWRQSQVARRLRRKGRIVMSLATGAAVVVLGRMTDGRHGPPWIAALGFLVGAGAYLVVDSMWHRLMPLWIARKLASEGRNEGLFGRHTITIESEGLNEQTEHSQSRQSWSSVERVAEDERYIFIYATALSAHVIPRAAFPNREASNVFLEAARGFHAQARSGTDGGRVL